MIVVLLDIACGGLVAVLLLAALVAWYGEPFNEAPAASPRKDPEDGC